MGATVGTLGAYVATVLPRVRKELRRWRRLAEAIPDSERRARALASLDEKAANVEAVAVFATLAPLRRRAAALRAIVPLQVAIDYLDTLEEEGRDLEGDAYLAALHAGWVREVEALPGCGAVHEHLRRAVDRCGEGQRRTHAAASDEGAALKRWALALAETSDYRWWELAAGASSSVAAHALIAAAADPATTAAEAALIDSAYNPPIGALTVFLDDLLDRESDRLAGEHNYLAYYASGEEAAERLGLIANRAGALAEGLPSATRHHAILAGVAAFYLSAPEATGAYARTVRKRLIDHLGPSARILGSFVRLRQLGGRKGPGRAGNPPGP
jgi:tetraprenyl-beta-curcumene synthase